MSERKALKLQSNVAIAAAMAITRACPDLFTEAVRARMKADSTPWHEAAATEFLALYKLMKKDRDFPLPHEPLPGFGADDD